MVFIVYLSKRRLISHVIVDMFKIEILMVDLVCYNLVMGLDFVYNTKPVLVGLSSEKGFVEIV